MNNRGRRSIILVSCDAVSGGGLCVGKKGILLDVLAIMEHVEP